MHVKNLAHTNWLKFAYVNPWWKPSLNMPQISMLHIILNLQLQMEAFTHFMPLVPFYTPPPQKTSENQKFSDVFRGYRKKPVAQNELMINIFLKYFPFFQNLFPNIVKNILSMKYPSPKYFSANMTYLTSFTVLFNSEYKSSFSSSN